MKVLLINGSLMSFMDRAFFSASAQNPHPFRFKPAAAVVSARRAGTTSALDQINKYFLHQQMPVATSRYWNMVHGNTPEASWKMKMVSTQMKKASSITRMTTEPSPTSTTQPTRSPKSTDNLDGYKTFPPHRNQRQQCR